MSSRGNSDIEPEIDKNFDNRVSYGRKDPRQEIKEFRKEQELKEAESKTKNNEEEEKKKRHSFSYSNKHKSKHHKDKKKESVNEFMEQFQNSYKELYNLIKNCINEEEEKGGKVLKNEFYRKEKEDKRKLHEEKKKIKKLKELNETNEKNEENKNEMNDVNNNDGNKIDENQEKKEIRNESNDIKIKKINKKRKKSEDNFLLNQTQNILSNILQIQIDKDKKQLESSSMNNNMSMNNIYEDKNKSLNNSFLLGNIKENETINEIEKENEINNKEIQMEIEKEKKDENNNEKENKENENKENENINMNENDNINLIENIIMSANENDNEKEKEKIKDKEKEKENINYVNMINEGKVETEKVKERGHAQSKRGRGRPPKNFTPTINSYFDNTVKNNLNIQNQILPINNAKEVNTNSEKLLQKKRYAPKTQQNDKTKQKKKKKNKDLKDYINESNNRNSSNKTNETNLLEILFKEYGYNNIIYTITGNNENRIGENKMKKIRSGLNNLLGYEKNTKKIIETIVNMKKYNLIDENSLMKGARNTYKNKNKNNISLTSYHYHLCKDEFIYKYEVEKILKDGNILFKCCDKNCQSKAILYYKLKTFKIIDRHNLSALQHDYIQKGYDKYQTKMELRNWNDLQLKKLDERKSYIEWHKTKYIYLP